MGNELAINPKTIYAELQKQKGQMEAALPRHMSADRLARIAFTQLRVTPKLFSCTFESFMGCIMGAAQLGLEPGVNGQCYLIPYENQKRSITVCTLVPGWKGLIDLVSRSARASAWTGAIRKGDDYRYKGGSRPELEHQPGDDDVSEFTHVYAVGWVKDAQWPIIEFWSRAKVVNHLKQYNKVGDRHYALANENNMEMYGRKVALLQVLKYLPTSVELRDAMALEDNATQGKQARTIDMALSPGGLIPDGPSAEAIEGEGLMETLGWADEKREMWRSNYAQNFKDGVAYLRGEIEKLGRGTTQAPAGAQTAATGKAPDATQGAPAAAGRRRGQRQGQQEQQAGTAAADDAKEEDTPSTRPTTTTQSESGTSTSEAPTTAPTNGKDAWSLI